MDLLTGCPGLSRAGNPCARTPGPSGRCPRHEDPSSAPIADDVSTEPARTPAVTTAVTTSAAATVSHADHAHDYGFNGICTVPGCGRPRPAWLITTPEPKPAKVPLTGTNKVARNVLLGIVSLALTGALAHSVGASVTDRLSGETDTGTSLDLPPGVR